MNAFSLVASVTHINKASKGEMVGYGGIYTIRENVEYIAVVSCG
jgi:alanine racemase